MRISDRRYARDLRRYQLAWRMIRHEVRTRSVALWSELSIYRIKTLYEAYVASGRSPQRGSAPYQVAYFWSSLQIRTEASILAGFLSIYGALGEPGASDQVPTIARGERLCRAYEEFIAVWPKAQLRLEHAMLLLEELVRSVEMGLAECPQCAALVVADRLAVGAPYCAFCLHELQNGRRYDRRGSQASMSMHQDGWEPGTQGTLF